jgi:hypothetical protein
MGRSVTLGEFFRALSRQRSRVRVPSLPSFIHQFRVFAGTVARRTAGNEGLGWTATTRSGRAIRRRGLRLRNCNALAQLRLGIASRYRERVLDEATIDEIGRRLAGASPPGTRVILFGSHAAARVGHERDRRLPRSASGREVARGPACGTGCRVPVHSRHRRPCGSLRGSGGKPNGWKE